MSKIKDYAAQTASQQSLGNGLESTENMTTIEDEALFSNVMDTATAENSMEQKESDDEGESLESMTQKSDAADTKEKEVDETKPENPDEDVKSDAELQEVKEINEYQISVGELAKQLNVVLDGPVTAQEQNTPQVQSAMSLQVSVGGDSKQEEFKQKAAFIEEDLIRKVDVATLNDQLNKAMGEDSEELLDIPLPQEMTDQDMASSEGVFDEFEHMRKEQEQELDAEGFDFLKADDFQVQKDKKVYDKSYDIASKGRLAHVKEDIYGNHEASPTILDNEDPAVVLDVVSVDLIKMVKDSGEDADLFDLLSDSQFFDSLFSDIEDVGAESMVQSFMNQTSSQSTLSGTQISTGLTSAQQISMRQSILESLRGQIESTMLQMSHAGKSAMTRIQIYPPELGKIDIRFEVKGQQVKGELVANSQETKQFLETQISRFKEIMTDEGFDVESLVTKQDDQGLELQKSQNSKSAGSQSDTNEKDNPETAAGAEDSFENRQDQETSDEIEKRLDEIADIEKAKKQPIDQQIDMNVIV